MIWVIVLHGIWVLLKGIHFIYLLEQKQYRLNRFQSMIHDRGFFILFYSLSLRFPSHSIRSLLLIGFHTITTAVIFLYAFENIYLYDFLLYYVILAPFIAFAIVVTGIQLTAIPASLYQQMVMQIAAWKIRRSQAVCISVTGSYGKSEVVYYLKEVLGDRYNIVTTKENRNTAMGIAQTIIQDLKNDTDILVIESATYGTGQIRKATSYLRFSYAILTGIGNQHIDLFPSFTALSQEESSIIKTLPRNAQAYISDTIKDRDKLFEESQATLISYGFQTTSQAICRDYHLSHTGSRGYISHEGITIPVRTELLGKQSLVNMIPVVGIALSLGMKPHEIKKRVERVKRQRNRRSVYRGHGQSAILLDLINPSLESSLNTLDLLRRFPHKHKIFVLGAMTELGGERGEVYRQIIAQAVHFQIRIFVFQPGNGIKLDQEHVMIFNDVKTLKSTLISLSNKGTGVGIHGIFPLSFTESLVSTS